MTLTEQLTEIEAELRHIHDTAGDAALSDEQQTRWDELVEQRDGVNRQINDTEQRRAVVRQLAATGAAAEHGDGAAAGAPQIMRRVEPFDGSDVMTLTRMQARDKALKAVESRTLVAHLDDERRNNLDRLLRRWSRNCDGTQIARRLLLTENDAYHSAFVKLVTRTQPVLTVEEARAVEAYDEYRAMSIGTDSAGGFGIPVLIDPTIVLTAQGSPNDILDLARVETITTDEWKGVTSAGATWSFDTEAQEVSDDSPTLAQPNVPVHRAQGFVPYSIEVGMDYPNFASEMDTLLREGYAELVAEKLTTGSGTNEPTGIVTALDANTNVEVTPTTDGAFGAVDLYKLWDALPIKYRNRGDRVAWMSSTDVQNEARNFGTAAGSNFTVDLTEETIPRLFGRRFYLNDFMADFTATTGAANLLIVGDWQNYLVAQRAGMTVELVPHLLGTTNNRPTGQRGWFAWARIGGNSINDLGFRMLVNA